MTSKNSKLVATGNHIADNVMYRQRWCQNCEKHRNSVLRRQKLHLYAVFYAEFKNHKKRILHGRHRRQHRRQQRHVTLEVDHDVGDVAAEDDMCRFFEVNIRILRKISPQAMRRTVAVST